MHVCLLCIEFFGDSIYGGFGRATRFIGRELARRGVQVSVVVSRRSPDRPDRYVLDGMTVHQVAPARVDQAIRLFRRIKADVYHSQDTSMLTPLARMACPRSAHVVTFRDPMDQVDWQIETDHAGMPKAGWWTYQQFIANPLVTYAVRKADGRYGAAEFIGPKAQAIFGLPDTPALLPSPVDVPQVPVPKAPHPTLCWVGRWEGRKRIELFFELAAANPHVTCIAMGGARDAQRDAALRAQYGHLPNLQMPGVLDQFTNPAWSRVMGESWVLVNTSLREGLPTTFLEAAAHHTAVLSVTDPDRFASTYGAKAEEGQMQGALAWLLAEERWRARGEAGYAYVAERFAVEPALQAHLAAYAAAIDRAKTRIARAGR
jgi:glycosyltransferase involved in cell wall biosynthesis